MNHPHLAIGQVVNFVTGTGKIIEGKIAQVIHAAAARIEWAEHSAVAEFSDKKEAGTFHFPPEQGGANVASSAGKPKPTAGEASATAAK